MVPNGPDKVKEGDEGLLEQVDNSGLKGFHYKTWFLSGMGFFTDAYDLFIIGVVITILPLAGWSKLPTFQTSLLVSTSLLSAVIGALVFGRLLDRFGRKAIYGTELVLLVLGALGSAFLTPVNGVYILMAWRFLLGIGIGGDYATSSTIMAEYSNRANRGRLVGMVFSMQSLGLVVGPLAALALMIPGVAPTLIWKLLLGFGAIPAAIVIYGRRKLPEPPKYSLLVKGDVKTATRNWQKFTGMVAGENAGDGMRSAHWTKVVRRPMFIVTLLATAGTWFLMDWALYGNSIMSSTMLGFLVPSSITGIRHLITTTEYSALIFGLAAFPGYWLATFTVDKIGRKTIQVIGFVAMAITFGILGTVKQLFLPSYANMFLVLYGLSYFFIEFGPNVTTFIYPPEVFPASTRGLGSGASAAGGKTGAFIGTFLNLLIVARFAESGLFLILALLSVIGVILTVVILPEPKQKTLESSSNEAAYAEKAKSSPTR